MSKVLITEEYLTNLADTIREQNGSTDKYTPAEMPDAIAALDGLPKITDASYFFRDSVRVDDYLYWLKFMTNVVTTTSNMFYQCTSLASLDLSSFDTSKVIDMSDMFNDCNSLASLDLSNFNTSSVTDMSYMFYSCYSLTSLDLSSFDTSNVTNMAYMFYWDDGLTSLDLSSFDTSNVTNMAYMFYRCSALASLDLSNFDFTNVTSYNNMLYKVPDDCLIYVKDSTSQAWITDKFTNLTNVQIKEDA